MIKRCRGCRLASFLAVAGFSFALFGTEYVWTGGGEAGNWNDPGNWSPSDGTPGAGDTASFDAPGEFSIVSDVAIAEGLLTIRLGSGVTNVLSGAISGAGGVRIEGSCTATPGPGPSMLDNAKYPAHWHSAMIFAGDNSYMGGTMVTNSMLRGDTASAFGASGTEVLFSGFAGLWFNAEGSWNSHSYVCGQIKGYSSIRFMKDMTWNGTLTQEGDNMTRFFLCVAAGVGVDMQGSVNLPYFNLCPVLHNNKNTWVKFHDPVIVKGYVTYSTANTGGWCYFCSTGNAYDVMRVGYNLNVRCMTDMLLDKTRPIFFEKYPSGGTTGFDLYGHDQQATGLESVTVHDSANRYLGCSDDSSATMYLAGAEQDHVFCDLLVNDVSIVWDPAGDHVQTFSNRVHSMTGGFTVMNGTIRIAGDAVFANVPEITVSAGASFECLSTAEGSLAGLRKLVIEDGAVFTIGADTPKPFTDGSIDLVVRGSGKIVMPSGMSVTMKTADINGVFPSSSEVFGDDADWLDGGTVSALNSAVTSWKGPVDGRWADEANWTAGVPSGTQTACITAAGGNYTVTIDADAVLGGKLVVGSVDGFATLSVSAAAAMTNGCVNVNEGGKLSVASGGTFIYEGKGDGVRTAEYMTKVVTFEGGELFVDGGSVDFRNVCGCVSVAAGDGGGMGKVTVRGGSVNFLADTENDTFRVEEGGVVDMSAGSFIFDNNAADVNLVGFRILGGEMCVTGGVFGVEQSAENSHTNRIQFHKGDVLFGGDAILQLCEIANFDNKYIISPSGEGESLRFRFEGEAKTDPEALYLTFAVGDRTDGVSVSMDWTTSGMDDVPAIANLTLVGANRSGMSVFNLSNAVYHAAARGVAVGTGENGNVGVPPGPVRGVFNVVEGGELVIEGHAARQHGYSAWAMSGLTVGYSGRSKVTSGKPYDGELNVLCGGMVRMLYGDMGVGVGYAKGRVVVDGGVLNFNDHENEEEKRFDFPNATGGIGLFGGEGHVTVTNGAEFIALPDMFVGGTVTNRFPFQGVNFLDNPSQKMPADHSATGTLTVADATVDFKQDLVLGMDGFGIVRRIGSEGSFTAGNLVCTNVADVAYTGSRLEFVLDANGIAPINVTDTLSISDNSEVVVDMSAYVGRHRNFRLIGFGERVGDFDSVSITGVNAPNCVPCVEWTSRGFYLKMGVGTVITIR